jgi:hypothetical protein
VAKPFGRLHGIYRARKFEDSTMTTHQALHPDIFRQSGGTVDFDFYRSRTTAMRRQAKREVRLVRWTAIGLVALTVTFVAVLIAAAAQAYAPHGETIAFQIGAPRFE